MQLELEDELIHDLDENDLEIELPSNQFKEEPIRLIDFQGQNFKLNEDALNMIKSIEDDLIVVSIVGKARTGKSYLMNLLLDNLGKNGFDVGSTISSCTKGIWIYGNFRKQHGTNTKILFIDSEGTSSIDRSTKTYDSKIFALVVLISSLFVYNTTANIDEQGISELSLAAHLSTSIACNSSVDKETMLSQLAPNFIWVLRDFTLEKVHPETGEEISSKEYLEICLRKKISGKNSAENNLIRDNIIKYFKERDCITLPRPVESEEDLRNLKNVKFEKLKPNFKLELMNLKHKIFRDAKPKKINGKKLTGNSLANLIIEFVNSINSGVVPNINNAWDSVIAQDIQNYSEKALNKYKESIKILNSSKNSSIEIINNLLNYKLQSMMIYRQIDYINNEIFTNKSYRKLYESQKRNLLQNIEKIEDKIIKDDIIHRKKMNIEILKRENKDVIDKMFKNYYNYSKNNFSEMGNDLIKAYREYEKSDDDPTRLSVLTTFVNDNMKENVYYIVINTKSDFQTKINECERKTSLNNEEIKILEKTGKKLEEINSVLNSRIKHLEKDHKLKSKEINYLKEKYENLQKEFSTIKALKNKNNAETFKENNKKEVRLDSNLAFEGRNDCNCNCLVY